MTRLSVGCKIVVRCDGTFQIVREVIFVSGMIFTPDEQIRIKEVVSKVGPNLLLADYLEKFVWLRDFYERKRSGDPEFTVLDGEMKRLLADLHLIGETEVDMQEGIKAELTPIRRMILAKLSRGNNLKPQDLVTELRGLISDETLKKVS